MLDKQNKPTMKAFFSYCGNTSALFEKLNLFLTDELKMDAMMRFPYGNSYGWGLKYSLKRKHICDVFAEKDAFTVMLRLSNTQFEKEYDDMTDYTKEYIDNKYPCSDGGWIHYRVLKEEHLQDIEKLLQIKIQ
jgi:hypothetical protein